MAADDALTRIDAHIARGNELMEQNRAAFERSQAAFEDLRTFLRELTLRQEKVMRGMLVQLEEQTREIRQNTHAMREHTKAIRAGRDEFVQESRAQRAALFRMLDRFGGGDSPATA